MYKQKRILGVITARGGSKGIPGKNIKLIHGKPLIAYTIEAARHSSYLTRCIVSTDYEDIASISKEYGADVPFLRPSSLAQDTSTSIDVILHALMWCEQQGEQYDYVMVLQPTSPLRTAKDIDACITLIVERNVDSVMSMVELSDFSLKKLKKIDKDGCIVPFMQDEGELSSRRQDLEPVYKRNCAIYLTKTSFIKEHDLFGNVSLAYVMPPERSIDINDPIDFDLAEFFIGKNYS